MKWVLTLTLTFILITVGPLTAWGDTQGKPLAFKNITIETSDGQSYDVKKNIITSNGHVRMTVDDAVIEADALTDYADQNLIVVGGNVRMMMNAVTLTANQLALNTNTGWFEASGAAQFISPKENYRSETIRYNLKQMTGTTGPLQGLVQGKPKDFYLTGQSAQLNQGTTVISSAGLTRCPRKDKPDYIFIAQKMVIKGNDIYMENVFLKFIDLPIAYFPKLILQGDGVPRINLSTNQAEETDLSQMVDQAEKSAASDRKSDTVHVSPRFQILISPKDKPSIITVGQIYTWNRYTNESDLNFDSRGIFSFSDSYQIDWTKNNLTIDAKTDLVAQPQQELGLAFTKKAWKTDYGNWQSGLIVHWLYEKGANDSYQGIYGGYRLDYQFNPDLNLSYLDLRDLSGTTQDWERLEQDFLVINNYRLGGNVIYSLNIPLSLHYYIFNRGSYSLQHDSWTSQITGLTREVDCIKYGLGWDFAKNLIELTFKLKI